MCEIVGGLVILVGVLWLVGWMMWKFLTALNDGDETPGRVDYTQVVTTFDEVVVPYTSGFLMPGRRSTNITLQDRCPVDLAEHLTIPLDRQAIRWVLNAFTREGPADPEARIGCL